MEAALANASRILPIVLTAHGASAGNNMYWPEVYTNQPITDASLSNPYTDTPAPKTFGNVTPLDPQLFLSINEYAKEFLSGERSGKYTPLEVAQWLEDYAAEGAKQLEAAAGRSTGKKKAEYLRMATDVTIQVGLGRFFGAKLRAGVLYAVFYQTGDRSALEEALKSYRLARAHWAGLAETARTVYVADISVGEHKWLRGHWQDRIPALDEDVNNMAKKLAEYGESPLPNNRTKLAVQEALGRSKRSIATIHHQKPDGFAKGSPLTLDFAFEKTPKSAVLFYRHISQAERYENTGLLMNGSKGQAVIPAEYTNSHYSIEYYLEVRNAADDAWLFPGFNSDLASQPYFSIQKA